MKVTLKKVPTKAFTLMFASINVIAGFFLGILVTTASLLSPPEQEGNIGAWAIILFPIINGLLGLATGSFLTWIYNLLARRLGGIEMELESLEGVSLVNKT